MPVKLTPAFKQWFEGSKVVDAEGAPLVVYHGTTSSFDVFSKKKVRPNFTSPQKHLGFFFTNDSSYADRYTQVWGEFKDGANTMPVYLSLRKPKVEPIEKIGEIEDQMKQSEAKLYRAELEAQGFDGIVFEGETNAGFVREYVAFRPEQIKSAIGNIGNFNVANPDIRFSMPGLPNQTGMQTSVQTPNRSDHHFEKKIITNATSDVSVTMSFRQISPVGGNKAEYVFDIYRLDPPLKKPEDWKRTMVGSVIYYAGLKEPVLTQYHPGVYQLDRDRIISVARPGSSGGFCGDALKWSPVEKVSALAEADADGTEDDDSKSNTGAPCP